MKTNVEYKIDREDLPHSDEIIKVALYSIFSRILASLKDPLNRVNTATKLVIKPTQRSEIQIKQLFISIQIAILEQFKNVDHPIGGFLSYLNSGVEPAIHVRDGEFYLMFFRNGRISVDFYFQLVGYGELIEECFNKVKSVDKVVVPATVNKYFGKGLLLDHLDLLNSCHDNMLVVFER